MSILCIFAICASLVTAHGSFLVDGWRVWNNATLSTHSRVETERVPAAATLPSGQTLWIGARSSLRLSQDGKVILDKGCARLEGAGIYRFEAKWTDGQVAGSSMAELEQAKEIVRQYHTIRELRPMSQRP